MGTVVAILHNASSAAARWTRC